MRTRAVVLVVALLVVAGLGVGLGVAAGGWSGSLSRVGAAGRTASIRDGCRQWAERRPTGPGTAQWCTDMAQWMDRSMARYGLGPETMWGDPGRLRAVCERWLGTSAPPGPPPDPTDWCSLMVTWMTTHAGTWVGRATWGSWMRR